MQPQVGELLGGQLKHEVLGEPRPVAVDLLVQPLGALAVKARQVGVQQPSLSTDDDDALGDFADGQRLDGGVGVG